MPSLTISALENMRLTHDVVATIREIGEGKGKQDLFKERAPEVLENLKKVAIIESTESSNRRRASRFHGRRWNASLKEMRSRGSRIGLKAK